jgi:surface antigen
VSLTTQSDGTISGSLSYLYQDGQTSAVFSFSGSTNSGTATLTPSTAGGPISVTYSAKQMQFGECTQYLKFAQSMAQCTFTYSPGGALQ